jgi:hypothetical protein
VIPPVHGWKSDTTPVGGRRNRRYIFNGIALIRVNLRIFPLKVAPQISTNFQGVPLHQTFP